MSFRTWFAALQVARTFDRLQREWRRSPRRRRVSHFCLPAEVLEVRSLLSAYTAASVSALIADINAANKSGGTNTITLAANTTFDLTAVNNTTNGANGLPIISGNHGGDNLTIIGTGGNTIDRSTAAGTPAFRLFDVANGNSLTLESITLQNGLAQGSGAAADGGAIYNQGNLTLIGATVQNNTAQGTNGANGLVTQKPQSRFDGQAGGNAAGGGIWSSGSATLEGGTILQQNQALGGQGGVGGIYLNGATVVYAGNGGAGGGGYGGGLYEAGGSANVTNATLTNNTAAGGAGGHPYISVAFSAYAGSGGIGAGGGLYAAGGTLNVSSVIVQANQALGGTGGEWGLLYYSRGGGNGGVADGGGIDVAGGTATLAGSQLLSNQVVGGTGGFDAGYHGGNGGNAFGGGLYAGGGTLTLNSDTVAGNDALGGSTGQTDDSDPVLESSAPNPGTGAGGGIEIASAATVSLDSFTVNDSTNNYGFVRFDWGYDVVTSNIDGTYIQL
jgi:hypothetical protein